MKSNYYPFILVLVIITGFKPYPKTRSVQTLEENWQFINAEVSGAEFPDTKTDNWETVDIPHDWAIKGPFDKNIDAQVVLVEQDMEKEAQLRTGRTGALPHIGIGWYRKKFTLPEFETGKKVLLVFDGAMSDAQVFINGEKIGNHPYGYAYFYFDITNFVKAREENLLAVRLENKPFSSRWYPGAGIYRKVQLIVKDEVSFTQWGTFVSTPFVSDKVAQVNIKSELSGEDVKVVTEIKDADGNMVATQTSEQFFGNKM